MTASLHPQPFIEPGAPGYDASSPIQKSDGYELSIGDWVNRFAEFDKSVAIVPPEFVVQAYGGGGLSPNHCRLAIIRLHDDWTRLRLRSWNDSIALGALPPRVIEGLHLTEFLERFPQAQPTAVSVVPPVPVTGGDAANPPLPVTGLTVVTTPPAGYVKTATVRAALNLPRGSRSYAKLRAAVEAALGA